MQSTLNEELIALGDILAATEPKYRRIGLDPDTTVYLRVRTGAGAGAGDSRRESEWTSHKTGKTEPIAESPKEEAKTLTAASWAAACRNSEDVVWILEHANAETRQDLELDQESGS